MSVMNNQEWQLEQSGLVVGNDVWNPAHSLGAMFRLVGVCQLTLVICATDLGVTNG